MKRLRIITFILLVLFAMGSVAENVHVAYARAGGGGAGGAEGGGTTAGDAGRTGGPGPGPGHFTRTGPMTQTTPFEVLFTVAFFGFLIFGPKGAWSGVFKGVFFYKIKNPTQKDIEFWKDKALRDRIIKCYVAVQKAWSAQHPDEAKVYMSDLMIWQHRQMIDEMVKKNEHNIVSRVKVTGIRAVYVSPDKDDMRVLITGKMIDYRINISTKKLLAGSRFCRDIATESWRFIKRDGEWVADRINGEIVS